MNTIRCYSIIFSLAGIIAFAGCKKLIEIEPPSISIGTEQVFQTNEVANSALASIYIQMITNSGSMIFSNGGLSVYAGLSGGELAAFAGSAGTAWPFEANKLDINTGEPYSIIWRPAYTFIYGANAVIEGIAASTSPKLDDSTRNVLTGEALFIRAFCHFYLTNFFGDVPLVLTTDYRKTAGMKRTPQAGVYRQIVKDLQEAREKMRDDYSTGSGERVRPNKWAAAALLARVHLYMGNWPDAETQASDVIGAGHYTLPANLNAVFLKNSGEAIWQLKQDVSLRPFTAVWDGFNFIAFRRLSGQPPALLETYLMPDFFEALASTFIPFYYFTPQAAAVFEDGDKRKLMWVDSTPTPAAPPYNSVPYYHPYKYKKRLGNSGETNITEYFMVLRLAEQYLIRAEARAQQDDLSGAAADLDSLRHRAGLGDVEVSSKEAMLAAVALERQRELFSEWGHRWLDLKRTGKANAVLGAMPAKQPWEPHQLLYPIPVEEISANPALEQNPDY